MVPELGTSFPENVPEIVCSILCEKKWSAEEKKRQACLDISRVVSSCGRVGSVKFFVNWGVVSRTISGTIRARIAFAPWPRLQSEEP